VVHVSKSPRSALLPKENIVRAVYPGNGITGFIAPLARHDPGASSSPSVALFDLILGHGKRVALLAYAIAIEFGLTRERSAAIAEAAFNHDIGKLFVDDDILLQSRTLTKAEHAAMRQHTIFGARVVCLLGRGTCSNGVVTTAVCRSHHERWDGSGYPDGLFGEAIPLAARIVAVADAYDALLAKRPYKEAWPPEEAFDYVVVQSGTAFDPQVINAFAAVVHLVTHSKLVAIELNHAEIIARRLCEASVKYAELSCESLSGSPNGGWRRLRPFMAPWHSMPSVIASSSGR